MKRVLLALLVSTFAASCAVPGPYEEIVRPQRAPDEDVTVRAPNRRHERDEWREASARCAQYGPDGSPWRSVSV